MGRPVSIYVNDKISRRMERFPEVKWTAVVRPCIIAYLDKMEKTFPERMVDD